MHQIQTQPFTKHIHPNVGGQLYHINLIHYGSHSKHKQPQQFWHLQNNQISGICNSNSTSAYNTDVLPMTHFYYFWPWCIHDYGITDHLGESIIINLIHRIIFSCRSFFVFSKIQTKIQLKM